MLARSLSNPKFHAPFLTNLHLPRHPPSPAFLLKLPRLQRPTQYPYIICAHHSISRDQAPSWRGAICLSVHVCIRLHDKTPDVKHTACLHARTYSHLATAIVRINAAAPLALILRTCTRHRQTNGMGSARSEHRRVAYPAPAPRTRALEVLGGGPSTGRPSRKRHVTYTEPPAPPMS